jgi:sulfur-oxidizing protein SoxX
MNRQHRIKGIVALALAAMAASSCTAPSGRQGSASFPSADQAIRSSWQNMQPGWEKRLVQDDTQRLCSEAHDRPAGDLAQRIERMNAAMPIAYPASGKLVGDWKKGEAIAQSGFGMRPGDSTSRPNGGNCYACHSITKTELSFGTLGPALNGYGKLRGNSEAIVKYTYEKVYNAQRFTACSNMPRFGANAILTPEQIADVVALLVDPKSPVNQ